MTRNEIERESKAYRLGWMSPNPEREQELRDEQRRLDETERRTKEALAAHDRATLAMLRGAARRPRMTARQAVNAAINASTPEQAIRILSARTVEEAAR